MKKINFKKQHLLLLVFIIFIVIVLIGYLTSKYVFKDEVKTQSYSSYKMQIRIETLNDNSEKNKYSLKLYDDGKTAKIETNFLGNSKIYIDNERLIYEDSGRYNYIKITSSYRNLYDTISKIELEKCIHEGNDHKTYNPKIERQLIDEILKNLMINKKSTIDGNAIVTLKNNNLDEFTIYLEGIEGYRRVDIYIKFDELNDDYYNELPIFYDELLQPGNPDILDVLK